MREDVELVKQSVGKGIPVANRKALWTALRRIEALELRLNEFAKKYLGAAENMYRPDEEDSKKLVDLAQATASRAEWPLEEFQFWANNLMRFDETTLEKIGNDCKLEKPWEPFLPVCQKLINALDMHPATKADLGLQSIRHQLDRALKRLKGFMVLWYELGKIAPPPGLERPETTKEKLLREARERRASKGAKSE